MTVISRFLVTAAGTELHHSLDTNTHGSQLLQHGALRHPLAQVLDHQSHTAVLRE